MKKSNHQVKIYRITEVLPHNNADSLELIHLDGYQVVTKKDQFKPGDLAVYIQPDSVVPQTEPFRFIWENYITEPIGDVPVRRRRITVRKFRGEWSEGLLLPLTDFPDLLVRDYDAWHQPILRSTVAEGDDVSDRLGITHYDPDQGKEQTTGVHESGPGSVHRWPKSFKGWLYFLLHKIGIRLNGHTHGWDREKGVSLPYYDIDAFKNFTRAFTDGEIVIATEKIHGSNARFIYLNGKMYAGSRTLWKSPQSKCVWRKALVQNPWIEEWCREHEGFALYGEVVPTQSGFDYGTKNDEVKFFVFDIRTPNGKWADTLIEARITEANGDVHYEYTFDAGESAVVISKKYWVPVLYDGPFDLEKIKSLVDGQSTVPGVKHIREGVVVRPVHERHEPGLGRVILKLVSNKFLEKDSKQ